MKRFINIINIITIIELDCICKAVFFPPYILVYSAVSNL